MLDTVEKRAPVDCCLVHSRTLLNVAFIVHTQVFSVMALVNYASDTDSDSERNTPEHLRGNGAQTHHVACAHQRQVELTNRCCAESHVDAVLANNPDQQDYDSEDSYFQESDAERCVLAWYLSSPLLSSRVMFVGL